MKFACYTLGCKVNQYETQAMEQLLVERGLPPLGGICGGVGIPPPLAPVPTRSPPTPSARAARAPDRAPPACGRAAQSPPRGRKLGAAWTSPTGRRGAFVRHMIEAAATRARNGSAWTTRASRARLRSCPRAGLPRGRGHF